MPVRLYFITSLFFYISFASLIISIFKTTLDKALPFTFMFIILCIFICGLLGVLKYGVVILQIIGFSGLFVSVYLNKNDMRALVNKIFNLQLSVYIFIVSLFFLLLPESGLISSGELLYWGLYPKNIFATNLLTNKEAMNLFLFVDYPPFIGLMGYFGLKMAFSPAKILDYSQIYSMTILTLSNIFFVCSFAIISLKKGFNSNILSFLFRILILLAFFGYNITYLQIEPKLTILFACGLLCAFDLKNNFSKFNIFFLSLIIASLPLLKVAGVFFAFIIILIAFFTIQKNALQTKSFKIKAIILFFLSSTLPILIWSYYSKI